MAAATGTQEARRGQEAPASTEIEHALGELEIQAWISGQESAAAPWNFRYRVVKL